MTSWTDRILEDGVTFRLLDELYSRVVLPAIADLRKYRPFSSNVYGELMPPLIADIIRITNLTKGDLFLDLGSGVGQVAIQVALQAGCRSYGIEQQANPARIARTLLQQAKIRTKMWGVKLGEVELEEGDMLMSLRVQKLIPEADVVLVTNLLFSEQREYLDMIWLLCLFSPVTL